VEWNGIAVAASSTVAKLSSPAHTTWRSSRCGSCWCISNRRHYNDVPILRRAVIVSGVVPGKSRLRHPLQVGSQADASRAIPSDDPQAARRVPKKKRGRKNLGEVGEHKEGVGPMILWGSFKVVEPQQRQTGLACKIRVQGLGLSGYERWDWRGLAMCGWKGHGWPRMDGAGRADGSWRLKGGGSGHSGTNRQRQRQKCPFASIQT
jgi:hypothetical protein